MLNVYVVSVVHKPGIVRVDGLMRNKILSGLSFSCGISPHSADLTYTRWSLISHFNWAYQPSSWEQYSPVVPSSTYDSHSTTVRRWSFFLMKLSSELENLCNSMHACCGICKEQCNCDSCSRDLQHVVEHSFSDNEEALDDNNEQTNFPAQPSKAVWDKVCAALLQYRDSVCTVQGSGALLFGKKISSGILTLHKRCDGSVLFWSTREITP